jgi:anti-anti-sigma factor
MNMTLVESEDIRTVVLEGKLDIKGAQAIEVRFAAVTASRDKVAVDLTAVDYIASIGIRILVMAAKAASRRGGRIVLFGASEPVSKVLGAAGLTEIVPLVGNRDSAMAALA